MKECPILFNAPMVRALLEGRKTQTRRIIKGVPSYMHYGRDIMDWSLSGIHQDEYLEHNQLQASDMWYLDVQTDVDDHSRKLIRCPYGQPGDRLWVRETFSQCLNLGADSKGSWPAPEGMFSVSYAATDGLIGDRWKPSIHMPRWASRILLEVVSVRVERLQDIGEADAIAEGVEPVNVGDELFMDYLNGKGRACTAGCSFASLWQSINGPESWDANPWVWVVEFRRVQP